MTIKRDATAPQLAVPDTILQENAPAAGVTVDYTAGAADSAGQVPGARLRAPVGLHVRARRDAGHLHRDLDTAGNTTKDSFEVIVLRPEAAPVVLPAGTVTIITAAPNRINHTLDYKFAVNRRYTQLKRLTIQNLPAGAMVTINCRGAACPKALKNRTFTCRVAGTSLDISLAREGQAEAAHGDHRQGLERDRRPVDQEAHCAPESGALRLLGGGARARARCGAPALFASPSTARP